MYSNAMRVGRLHSNRIIVLTSSIGGLTGAENIGNYIASKHGMIGLMRTLGP